MLRRIPGTLGLIIVNILVFSVCVLSQKSDGTEDWTLHLLQFGAQFNPLTLDKQWYRIFTHMFLHASILHLAFNMYALFSVGALLEPNVGTKKFLMIYFVCGIAAALTSLYWSLFLIGVGASGAIFGLFGFSLVMNLFLSRRSNQPTTPLIVNFFVFIVLNLMIAKAVRADNAAHFGGLVAGAVIGSYSVVVGRLSAFRRVHIEHLCLLLLVIVWFSLPRFQVSYFKFFNYVVALEDATEQGLQAGRTDAEYLRMSVENVYKWDTAMQMLNDQHYVPEELAADTFRLRRYIRLHKEENLFRKKMIERQSYTYLDSLAWVHEQMAQYTGLDYHLAFNRKPRKIEPDSTSSLIPMKVWFDEDWIEVPSPPASYYRIGYRDSLGKWNGPVQDFYENGAIQMKGTYRDDKRDGVFLFYSDHNTYTSAGRFVDDKSVGKWETFHYNGELESEIYYNEYYFLRNLWDSVGNQMVTEGNGKETRRFSNDIVSLEGIYKNGLREGYWYGRHANGEMYFEEFFKDGRLVSGRSRNLDGDAFTYDESSLFPVPQVGARKFQEYLASMTKVNDEDLIGTVHLSFRVTAKNRIADVRVEKSLTPQADERAKAILLNGPPWSAARIHGHEPTDGFARVVVEFRLRD